MVIPKHIRKVLAYCRGYIILNIGLIQIRVYQTFQNIYQLRLDIDDVKM